MPEDFELDQAGLAEAFNAARNGTVADVATPDPAPVSEPEPTTATPSVPDVVTLPQKSDFNVSEWLKTSTEGLIDSEDKFKEFIPKIKNFDSLETKIKELETKIPNFKNEESQKLFELWQAGEKKAVRDYIAETERDYTTMSDLDVVRSAIAKEHPEWDSKGIELEVRGKFGKQIEPIDLNSIEKEDEDGKITQEYRDAIAHNEKAEENLLRLQIAARDGRKYLIDQQQKIELPAINKADTIVTPNMPTEQELADRQAQWEKSVEENLPKLSNLKMNIDDKEVEYVRTADEMKDLTDYMKTFNIFKLAKERGWTNEDGTPNPLKIAEDVDFLNKREQVIRSLGSQLATSTKKEVLKQIKNIPDSKQPVIPDDEPVTLGDAYAQARQKAGW